MNNARRPAVQIVSVRMKTIWLAALLAIPAQAQNVFLLGSNTALPPDLNGNVQPVPGAPVAVAPAQPPVTVNVNVNGGASTCAYPQQYYAGCYPQCYSPNVTYVGGGYCNYYPNYSSSVIYFGGIQACREGYRFRHYR